MTGPIKTDIWMPMFWGDYLRDTMHLTTAQHGAYLLMIAAYWTSGDPLPDDDGQLRSIAKFSPHNWKKNRAVLVKFFTVRDGAWHHDRIDAELRNAAENKARRSAKGKTAAKARWQRDDAYSIPQAMLGACPSPSPSPSPFPVPTGTGAPAPFDPRNYAYAFGKQVLGERAGGLITKLSQHTRSDWWRVCAILERAEKAADARQYVAGVLHGNNSGHGQTNALMAAFDELETEGKTANG